MTSPVSQEIQTHPEPAENDASTAAIAEVLALGVSVAAAAAEIETILAPYLISRRAIRLVLSMIDGKRAATAHKPYARLAANGISAKKPSAVIARQAARTELYLRAAFVTAASSRIQRDINNGADLSAARRRELVNFTRHELARRKRLDTAAKVAKASDRYGPVLGWYRQPESNSEADCRIADGNNFYAAEGTIIGLPGAVHPHCACVAGPPHPGGRMVNDALTGRIVLVPRKVASVA